MATAEVIVFNGVKFRRYPDSPNWPDRMYFTPGIGDRQRGAKRLHEEIWMAANGPIPPGYHVHHDDRNPLNNDLGNLQAMPRSDHYCHHAGLRRGVPLPPERLAMLEIACLAAREWHGTAEGLAWHAEHGRQTWAARVPEPKTCEQCGSSYETRTVHKVERFCSNNCKSAWRRASKVDDVDRACVICGTGFRANKYAKTQTCSRTCRGRFNHANQASRRAGRDAAA